MTPPRLLVRVDDDGSAFRLSAADRQQLQAWAGKWVVIRTVANRRSLDQNAYLHAEPFRKLAKEWGESVERTKLICMGEFWGWEPCKVSRSFLPVKAHTSDMTVEECTQFIDWLIPWANTEHGVDVRLPEEWDGPDAD